MANRISVFDGASDTTFRAGPARVTVRPRPSVSAMAGLVEVGSTVGGVVGRAVGTAVGAVVAAGAQPAISRTRVKIAAISLRDMASPGTKGRFFGRVNGKSKTP